MSAKPTHLRLRAYQVGFGDCLLLTITYGSKLPDGRKERHVLVDFGSRVQHDAGPSMTTIGELIAEHCGGQLDVVVATHRHQDHIKGFGDVGARAHIDSLDPKLVVRPWTDIPEDQQEDPGFGLDQDSSQFISVLEDVHRQAQAVQDRFQFDESKVARQAAALADLGIKNARAIATLEAWADDGEGAWVKAGDELDVESLMPGVRVQVLGPPTLAQVPNLTSYASTSAEYWLALAEAREIAPMIKPTKAKALAHASVVLAAPDGLGAAGWLLRSMQDVGSRQVLDIVEGFDDVLNNTSVVLLVTIGKRSLLLAGDAQIENWSFSLDTALGENGRARDAALRRQLSNVELYKVGHHGSRNATPKRLVALWDSRDHTQDPLVSVLCTKEGVYDKSTEGTVPKPTLMDALSDLGPLHSTDDLPDGVWWFDVEASTTGPASFTYAEGPPAP